MKMKLLAAAALCLLAHSSRASIQEASSDEAPIQSFDGEFDV